MTNYFDIGYMLQNLPVLLGYIHITLFIGLSSAVLGIAGGCAVAVIRFLRLPVLSQFLVGLTSFVRGMPILVQIFLFCFGGPEILGNMGWPPDLIPPIGYIVFVFSVYVAIVSGEIIRGAIMAIPKGQMEAAAMMNMSSWNTYRSIIIPQALMSAVLPLINTVIGELKATAIAFNVGVIDMVAEAQLLAGFSQRYLELYIDIALIYGVMVFLLGLMGRKMEICFEKQYRG